MQINYKNWIVANDSCKNVPLLFDFRTFEFRNNSSSFRMITQFLAMVENTLHPFNTPGLTLKNFFDPLYGVFLILFGMYWMNLHNYVSASNCSCINFVILGMGTYKTKRAERYINNVQPSVAWGGIEPPTSGL